MADLTVVIPGWLLWVAVGILAAGVVSLAVVGATVVFGRYWFDPWGR